MISIVCVSTYLVSYSVLLHHDMQLRSRLQGLVIVEEEHQEETNQSLQQVIAKPV